MNNFPAVLVYMFRNRFAVVNCEKVFYLINKHSYCNYSPSCFWSFNQSEIQHRCTLFIPQPLRAVGVLLSPMVSGWAGWPAGGRVAGKSLSGLYLRNRKVYEVHTS